jgi:hypothetical protein
MLQGVYSCEYSALVPTASGAADHQCTACAPTFSRYSACYVFPISRQCFQHAAVGLLEQGACVVRPANFAKQCKAGLQCGWASKWVACCHGPVLARTQSFLQAGAEMWLHTWGHGWYMHLLLCLFNKPRCAPAEVQGGVTAVGADHHGHQEDMQHPPCYRILHTVHV